VLPVIRLKDRVVLYDRLDALNLSELPERFLIEKFFSNLKANSN
jgi:hypothetical protein